MLTLNIAALTRCVTTRQVKEIAQLGCVLSDQQYLLTSKPTSAKTAQQSMLRERQQNREWRDPMEANILRLNTTLGNRSLNSI